MQVDIDPVKLPLTTTMAAKLQSEGSQAYRRCKAIVEPPNAWSELTPGG